MLKGKFKLNSIEQIKQLVLKGESIFYRSNGYQVVQNKLTNQFLVKCLFNGYCVGLTDEYNPDDFYMIKAH